MTTKLCFKGREIEVVKLDLAKYIDECQLIAANWGDTHDPLTDEELEDLAEDRDFESNLFSYIWSKYPDECILSPDQ